MTPDGPITFAAAALRADRRVVAAAHPLAYPLVRAGTAIRPVMRLPGLGVLVADASTARRVLLDTATFRKDGPGSSGALWTPVVGRYALLNMEGEEHRRLRAALSGLFTPGYAEALCERVLAGPLVALTAALAAGDVVDVAAATRVMAGRVAAALIGIDPAAGHGERDIDEACRMLLACGEEITGMITLRTRSLSESQQARAKKVLAEVTGPATAAWRRGDPETVPGRMRSLGLGETEARGAAAAFFLTGTETLTGFVPRLLAMLADGDHAVHALAEAWPARSAELINEGLRVAAPSPAMLRRAAADTRLGPVRVRAGDRVVIATLLACTRQPDHGELRQLYFGAGPHFCLGRPLAVAETGAIVGAVLAAGQPGQRLQVVRRAPVPGVLIPAYRRLDLRWWSR